MLASRPGLIYTRNLGSEPVTAHRGLTDNGLVQFKKDRRSSSSSLWRVTHGPSGGGGRRVAKGTHRADARDATTNPWHTDRLGGSFGCFEVKLKALSRGTTSLKKGSGPQRRRSEPLAGQLLAGAGCRRRIHLREQGQR